MRGGRLPVPFGAPATWPAGIWSASARPGIRDEAAKYARLIKEAGIKVE